MIQYPRRMLRCGHNRLRGGFRIEQNAKECGRSDAVRESPAFLRAPATEKRLHRQKLCGGMICLASLLCGSLAPAASGREAWRPRKDSLCHKVGGALAAGHFLRNCLGLHGHPDSRSRSPYGARTGNDLAPDRPRQRHLTGRHRITTCRSSGSPMSYWL